MLFQIMAAYFQDDQADALRNDPALTAAVGKETLASQPTLSRFYNRLDENTLAQLGEMLRTIRSRAYSVEMPEHVLFDLDSTLFATFGKQEGGAFNFHYQANGYHPLLCFDGMTGDLLKIELRPGTQYCCNGAAEFMRPLLEEYQRNIRRNIQILPCFFAVTAGLPQMNCTGCAKTTEHLTRLGSKRMTC